MRSVCLASVAVLAMAVPASAAETIDNPQFAMWLKHKKGPSITLKTTSTGDATSETVTTTALLEVGNDKVVVEMSGSTKISGMEFKTPPTKREVAKTFELPEGTKKEDFREGGKPKGTYEEGTETLKVAGAEYKTKWYKYKVEIGQVKGDAKLWVCDDVPGTMVKMEMTTVAAGVTSKSTMELIDFKKP